MEYEGGDKMAVAAAADAAAPLIMHSEEEEEDDEDEEEDRVGDSLILISPLTGPSLEQRRAPPDVALPPAAPTAAAALPLQLLSAPALGAADSWGGTPESLQVLVSLLVAEEESESRCSLCLCSSSLPRGLRRWGGASGWCAMWWWWCVRGWRCDGGGGGGVCDGPWRPGVAEASDWLREAGFISRF